MAVYRKHPLQDIFYQMITSMAFLPSPPKKNAIQASRKLDSLLPSRNGVKVIKLRSGTRREKHVSPDDATSPQGSWLTERQMITGMYEITFSGRYLGSMKPFSEGEPGSLQSCWNPVHK